MGLQAHFQPFCVRRGVAGAFLLAALSHQSLFCGSARGEDYDIIPSVTVKEEYNDNIFFSAGSRTGAFITAVSPRIELAKRDERTDAALIAGIDEFVYRDRRGAVTALNQNYRGRVSYVLTPRLQASVDAAYEINNRPDRDLERDGGVIDAVRRDRQSYSLATGYALSEKTTASLAYFYDREDYRGLPTSDNRAHTGSLGVEYDLSAYLPSAKARANLGFTRYELSDSMTDNYTATVGMGWAISETWGFTVDAGGRYTRADFDALVAFPDTTVRLSNSGFGWVAKAALSVRGEVQNGSLVYNRNVTLSTSRSGASESDSVDLNYRRYFTPEFSSAVTVGYQLSRSEGTEFSAGGIDEDYIRLKAGMRYEFTRHTAVDASYSYAKAVYNQSNLSADRNTFLVSFTVRYPLLDRW